MTATHQALWVDRRGTFRVGPAPTPTPRPGELVVEAHAVALNPVDAMPGVARRFVYPWLRLPTVLGTDVAGTVVAVGEGVSRFRIGDRVVGFASGQERFRNDPAHGAFQHVVVLAADLTAHVPDEVALTDAVVLPLALTTAAAGLFEPDQLGLPLPVGTPVKAGDERDETVLVWGAATSVGNNAVQLARAAGYRVVATASPRSAALVLGLGASAVVDYRGRSAVDEVVAALEGHTLAGTVAIGAGSLSRTIRVARRTQGTRRVASAYPSPVTAVRRQLARPYGVRVSAIWGGSPARSAVGPAMFRDVLPVALAHGRYRPSPPAEVVGEDLASIPAGLERLRGGVAARKLVVRLRRDPDPR
ncbi:zinc-binding alcohol dehydrogenase family protein [Microlunatus antarcticus]|uniref:NADPH:quinone reductase-like Zn-dependent oxidoreductase n=1 Tax=Microlunatus antarcticus TaxID=53388 RepID=A0A7W5JT21_9ACTN|nr:zinc-binding alcohol dehydrogenase family protein [Microlunatus antarcticus]MBB3325844.1 NADPH:quinone reductase-like Zn-dependent oxidoreductase [Microlunatus antarcticus]